MKEGREKREERRKREIKDNEKEEGNKEFGLRKIHMQLYPLPIQLTHFK